MIFSDLKLSNALKKSIDDVGYLEPTPIQRECFAKILSGRDLVGVAQTGTGKTWAYLLPILRNIKYSKDDTPRAIIIVPTRELVIQVVGELEKLTRYMSVRVAGVYGGTNINTQKMEMKRGQDIVVGTPGRLMDLAMIKSVNLRKVKQVVIDEMDEMMKQGFRHQLLTIFDLLPRKRQHILFSATMSNDIEGLIEGFFNSPEKVIIAAHGTPLEQISQSIYQVNNFNTKINLMLSLLKNDSSLEKVLVFSKSKRFANLIFERLQEEGIENLGVIHGNKSQNFRNNTVIEFESGNIKYLIATDLVSRGIDVSNITHVVNFDLPEVKETYIHRIGRTGRADKPGAAISFVADYENNQLDEIQELMNIEIPVNSNPEDLIISEKLLKDEIPDLAGDKHYLPNTTQIDGGGAFHDKKLKNQKVNVRRPRKPVRNKAKKRRG